jgi:hypothetical protein
MDSIEYLPTALTRAGVSVLPADALGVSAVNDHFRIPLGASNDDALAAERLQFTVGEGPCLQALRDRTEVRADKADLNRRWPAFHHELISRTPYRSIASLPVILTPKLEGAIDFYFTHPSGAIGIDLDLAAAVADQIVNALRATSAPKVPPARTGDDRLPRWLYSPSASGRLRTWIAVGIVMSELGLSPADVLARIRSYAYANQQEITHTTEAIIDGTLPADALTL